VFRDTWASKKRGGGQPEPIKGVRKKHYQYTAIDDCTRLRVLKIYERLDQKTAIRFVDYVLKQLPFQVMKVQTDNGAEFQAGFHWHPLDKGIQLAPDRYAH
jgi:transposase-like protein